MSKSITDEAAIPSSIKAKAVKRFLIRWIYLLIIKLPRESPIRKPAVIIEIAYMLVPSVRDRVRIYIISAESAAKPERKYAMNTALSVLPVPFIIILLSLFFPLSVEYLILRGGDIL